MKGVNKENIKKHALNEFLSEYKELNTDNKYRPVAVGRYGIRKRESIYSKELAKDYSKNKLIHKDTLTVGMGSKQIDIGILIEDETFAVSPAYHTYKIQGIRCKYLEYCLQSKNIEMFSLYAKRGSRQGKSIDLKRWLTYKIPVYSEEDQIVIEENLNKINVVIELRRKQLELLDELVRARFVEMFGDPIENQKDWEVVKIRDIVTDVRYGTSKPAVEGGRYPYLRMNNLTVNGGLDLSDLKYIDIPDNEIEKCVVRKGDILFNRTNSIDLIGKTAVFNLLDDMVIAGYIIRIRLNKQILPDVFSQYMNLEAMKKVLRGMAKGAVNQANINAQELQSIKVYIPNMELQKQYVEFKEAIDKSRLLSNHSLFFIKSIIF